MIEVRILDKNHVEAASGLRLARLHRAAELIGELDTGVRNAIIVIVTNKKGLKKYDLLNLLTTCKSKEVAGAGEEESKLGI